MATKTLLTITQKLRQLPKADDAAMLLASWITERYGIAYFMLPSGLLTAQNVQRNPRIVRWLQDRLQWRDMVEPQLTDDGLFAPLIFNGRTQGIVVVEGANDGVLHTLPLIEILAARLDTEYTAQMIFQARQLSEHINHASSLDEMLARTVEGIVPLFGSISSVVFRFEPDDKRGESIAEFPTRVVIGRYMGADDHKEFTKLFQDRSILIIDEEMTLDRMSMVRTAMRTVGAKQVVAAPMYAAGRLIGAITIALDEADTIRKVTGREQQVLLMIAQVVSNAYVLMRRLEQPQHELLHDSMFHQLIDKANVAIDIHAPDGTVIYRNQAWNDLFMRHPSEPQVFADRLLNEEKVMVESLIYPNATRSKGWTNFITLKRKDLTQFDAHVSVVALRDNQENVIGYSTITDDVTDLHHVMDALQAQTTRLAAAASVSQAIITTPDLDELAESVLRLICTQFNYDLAQIWRLNEARNELTCLSASNIQGDVLSKMQGQVLSLQDNNAAKWVISNGRLLVLNDAQNDPRHWQHPSLPMIGSELVLLLQASHEMLGVLVVQSKKRDVFLIDDADVMQTIADQLAIAIYNASLFSQLSERLADMSAMGEVSLLVQAAYDTDGLMRRIYDAMRRVHVTGNFSFAMADNDTQRIKLIQYHNGQSQKLLQPIGNDLVSQMLSKVEPVFWRNADERAATAKYFELSLDDMPYSFLGLPVIAKDSVLGVLFTESNSYSAFDENDLQFMLTLVNSAAFALENMQLHDDTKRRVREMEIINSISHTLSDTFGLNAMWDYLAQDLKKLFPHGAVSIALYDAQLDRLNPPPSDTGHSAITVPPEALSRAIVRNGYAIVLPDLSDAEARLTGLGIDPATVDTRELRSWIGMPLKNRNNEIMGIIAIQSTQPDAFTGREFSLLNMVAAQTSLAMDNAYLLVAEQERREVANSLIDMGRIVTSTLDVEDVFGRILEQIARLLDYERAAILLPSDTSLRRLLIHAVDGFDQTHVHSVISVNASSPLWQVLQKREPIVIPNIADNSIWHEQPEFIRSGEVRSWMGVPLVVQGQVQGMISLDTPGHIPYNNEDVEPILALARQASIAIENAQLHSELASNVNSLKLRAERLATMHQLANYVSSSLEQSAILEHTASMLTDLFKADYACIIRIDEMNGHGYLVAEHPQTAMHGQVMIKGTDAYEHFQEIVRQNAALLTDANAPIASILPITTPIETCAVAPLIAHERVLGSIILALGDNSPSFDDENLETFMTIAAQIAVAVRNAELFQDALDANRLKSEFLANVSHELRTPLNAIIGYSELLLSGTYGRLDDKQEDRLERVFRSGRQLLDLINDILDLSKIEAGKMDLELIEMDIGALVADATSTIQPQVEYKQLNLIMEIQPDLPPIYADAQRMRQILVNLLSNAVKFTKDGQIGVYVRRTTVSLREFPNLPLHMVAQGNIWLHLSVSDTGIGINEKDQQLIFDAFTQADGSSVREYEGTGLGLAITQELVKLHKGFIWLESEVGEGSTFHILLPSMQTMQAPRYYVAEDDERPVIVLMDEDEVTLQLLTEYINPQVYNIISTRDVNELSKIVASVRPSIIITDLMIPRSDGLEVLNRLNKVETLKDVPIVVCSILDREREAKEMGAAAYIKKPATRRDITTLLNDLI